MSRYENYDPFSLFRGELDQLFENFLSGPGGFSGGRQGRGPALNAWETDEEAFVEAEVPGLAMEDLDLTVQGNELTICGEHKPKQIEKAAYHRQERPVGKFTRVLRLPYEVDTNSVEAQLKNGVLTIRLPKAPSARPRKINVVQ